MFDRRLVLNGKSILMHSCRNACSTECRCNRIAHHRIRLILCCRTMGQMVCMLLCCFVLCNHNQSSNQLLKATINAINVSFSLLTITKKKGKLQKSLHKYQRCVQCHSIHAHDPPNIFRSLSFSACEALITCERSLKSILVSVASLRESRFASGASTFFFCCSS